MMQRAFLQMRPCLTRRPLAMLTSAPHRNISLLVNDQFLNEDQRMIQQMAYDFAASELAPHAAEWDKTKHFPIEKYKLAAE